MMGMQHEHRAQHEEDDHMPINIRIDAEVEGKKLKFDFGWKCNHDEIAKVMDHVRGLANKEGVTPQVFAEFVVRLLPETGVLKDATGAIFQRQLTAIIFVVLDAAEKRVDDLPAPIADLAEHDHIYVTLLVRDDGLSLKLSDSEFETVH
jgi:hypothetical protein